MAGLLLLIVGFAHLGCSETTRYRVLSFFFDGVPSPEERAADEARADADADRKTPEDKREELPIVTSHAPYRDRECSKCHADASMQADIFDPALCEKCHKQHFAVEATDWVHGPVAAGECGFCHEPHESQYPSLLKTSQSDLCLQCHSAETLTRTYHSDAKEQACSTCHDPHFAGNRLLLADSRTFKRSKTARRTSQSVHDPWKQRECSACHDVENASQLVEDMDAACLSCHEKEFTPPPGKKLHSPVRQKQCALCHEPHESPRLHLVRTSGEKICYTCHEPEEIRNDTHPSVNRVDCLLCHAGHSSRRKGLLKPGIPSEKWPDKPLTDQRTNVQHDRNGQPLDEGNRQ